MELKPFEKGSGFPFFTISLCKLLSHVCFTLFRCVYTVIIAFSMSTALDRKNPLFDYPSFFHSSFLLEYKYPNKNVATVLDISKILFKVSLEVYPFVRRNESE